MSPGPSRCNIGTGSGLYRLKKALAAPSPSFVRSHGLAERQLPVAEELRSRGVVGLFQLPLLVLPFRDPLRHLVGYLVGQGFQPDLLAGSPVFLLEDGPEEVGVGVVVERVPTPGVDSPVAV